MLLKYGISNKMWDENKHYDTAHVKQEQLKSVMDPEWEGVTEAIALLSNQKNPIFSKHPT